MVGVGRTIMLTEEVTTGQGLIPVVVSVSTAVPEYPTRGVHVAVKVLAFGENVPPAGVLQVPPVAEPPVAPAIVADPPWQMVCGEPALEVGVGLTITLIGADTAAQGLIPVVVRVNIAVPANPIGGFQAAFNVFAFGENVPPAGVVQVPPVAEPPKEPFN